MVTQCAYFLTGLLAISFPNEFASGCLVSLVLKRASLFLSSIVDSCIKTYNSLFSCATLSTFGFFYNLYPDEESLELVMPNHKLVMPRLDISMRLL